MKRKTLYILILLVLIASSFAFYLYKTNNTHEKCPDDYDKNTDSGMAEYKTDMDKWTNDFFDSHPRATLDDWSNARYQFWINNDCKEALRRYKEAKDGNADPTKMNLIEDTIQETINNTN